MPTIEAIMPEIIHNVTPKKKIATILYYIVGVCQAEI
jgi:hypothetical protein